jgi:predicted transcriptional regulator
MPDPPYLSAREQQIMEIVYRAPAGVTAADVQAQLPDPLSNSAVRTFLKILEHKGHLVHETEAGRYIYRATVPATEAGGPALSRVIDTFFAGSLERAMTALLSERTAPVDDETLAHLRALIDAAREKGN